MSETPERLEQKMLEIRRRMAADVQNFVSTSSRMSSLSRLGKA